jgi:hypothetical protein
MKVILICIALAMGSVGFAQTPASRGTEKSATIDDAAAVLIDHIMDAVGLKANFVVKHANVANAVATTINGQRWILYNPYFFKKLIAATGSSWTAVSVLAHEIGHHLNGHTLGRKGNSHENELQADEFSGFVLRKMGASLDAAQAAMQVLATEQSSATHPRQSDRLVAIERGWRAAAGEKMEDVATNDRAEQKKKEQTVLDSKDIWKKIDFAADRKADYYITTGSNVVMVKDNELRLLGVMKKTTSEDVPYIIEFLNERRVAITATGKIVNSEGKTVGSVM